MTFATELAARQNAPIYLIELDVQKGSTDIVLFDSGVANMEAVGDATTPAAETSNAKEGTQSVSVDKSDGDDTDSGVEVEFTSAVTTVEDFETHTDWDEGPGAANVADEAGEYTQGSSCVEWDKDSTAIAYGEIWKDGTSHDVSANDEIWLDVYFSDHSNVSKVTVGLDESENVGTSIEDCEAVGSFLAWASNTSGISTEGTSKVEGSNSLEFDKEIDGVWVFEDFSDYTDWTGWQGTEANIADETSTIKEGSNATKFDKTGAGNAGAGIYKTISSHDCSVYHLMGVWVYVPDATNVNYIQPTLGEDDQVNFYRFQFYTIQDGWNWLVLDPNNPTSTAGAPSISSVERITIYVVMDNAADTFSEIVCDGWYACRNTGSVNGFPLEPCNNHAEWTAGTDVTGLATGADYVEFDKSGGTQVNGHIYCGYTAAANQVKFLNIRINSFTKIEAEVNIPSLTDVDYIYLRLGGTNNNPGADYLEYRKSDTDLTGGGFETVSWNLHRPDATNGTSQNGSYDMNILLFGVSLDAAADTLNNIQIRNVKIYHEADYIYEDFEDHTDFVNYTGAQNIADESTDHLEGSSCIEWDKVTVAQTRSAAYKDYITSHGTALDVSECSRVRLSFYAQSGDESKINKIQIHLVTDVGFAHYKEYDISVTAVAGWNHIYFDPQNATLSNGSPDLGFIRRIIYNVYTDNNADTLTDIYWDDLRLLYGEPEDAGIISHYTTTKDVTGYDRVRACFEVPDATHLGDISKVHVRMCEKYDESIYVDYELSVDYLVVGWNWWDFDPWEPDTVVDAFDDDLLDDGSFDNWTGSTALDDWEEYNAQQSTTYRLSGDYCVELKSAALSSYIYQERDVSGEGAVQYTFGAYVRTSAASKTRLRLADGYTTQYSSYHTGGGDWEWLTVTLTTNASANTLTTRFDNAANNQAFVDCAKLSQAASLSAPDDVPIREAITHLALYFETNNPEDVLTDARVDNVREVVMQWFDSVTSPASGWLDYQFELGSPDTTYGSGSLDQIDRVVVRVTMAAAANTLTDIYSDWLRTKDVDVQDLSSYDTVGFCCYLSDVTDVAQVDLKLIDDDGNWSRWKWYDEPADGWNDVQVGISGTPESTSGTLDKTDVRYAQFIVVFDNAADTLTGILFDWCVGWKGVCHFSTHPVGSADSTLLKASVMGLPSEISQKADPEKGSTSISGVSFTLLNDGDGDVLESLSNNEWRGRRITLKMGFPGLDYTDYQVVNSYRIQSLAFDGARWGVSCSNDLWQLKQPVMTEATAAASVTITENIITAWLQILTSTGNGTNGDYDVLGATEGLGFPVDRLNITEIESERDDWLSAWDTEFVINKRIDDFKQWSDREVFKVCGAYMRIKNGLLSIKARRAPLASDSLDVIDAENTDITTPRWRIDESRVYNRVIFAYDYDHTDDEYDTTNEEDDDQTFINGHTSQDVFGVRELVIKSKGIKTTETTAMMSPRAVNLFQRYSFGPPDMEVLTHLSTLDLCVGDVVTFTNDEIPDLENDQVGVTNAVYEIYELSVNHVNGTVRMKVSDSGWKRGKYALISALADEYDAASAANKTAYVWIADTGNLLGSTDDDAYEVQPG